jgi:hypothetical protein
MKGEQNRSSQPSQLPFIGRVQKDDTFRHPHNYPVPPCFSVLVCPGQNSPRFSEEKD